MRDRAGEISPQIYARIGGILYLFIIIAAGFGEGVRESLIVWGDAAATANNIRSSETLFRIGLAGEMLTCVSDVALALILYVLLKPVNRNLALLGSFFRLTFVGIYGVAKLFEIAALVVLGRESEYLKAFEPEQLHALAYVSLRVHSYGYGISLLFFGFCCVFFGYLIHRSKYLPGIVGILLVIGGLGYIIFSVTQMLAPAFAATRLFPWIILPAFFAELSLCLWLILKGVNIPKWEERASFLQTG